MTKLSMTLACGWYDRILALMDGSVQPEGIDLNMLIMQPEELFWRMLQYKEFDASELSLGAYLILCGRGDTRFVGIPVFPSRIFRHSTIFINTASGISAPQDLMGKRVGIPDYTLTAGLWQRGIFEEYYHVAPKDIQWFCGGLHEPGRRQRVLFTPPAEVSLRAIDQGKTLDRMLIDGELDAIFTSRDIQSYQAGNPSVRRLWEDPETVERAYYREAGIFPIMHLIVVRRELYEQNPWIATSLYQAFEASKQICFDRMYSSTALSYSDPWSLQHLKGVRREMGDDFWPYGIEKNRHVLEKACEYAFLQGLTPKLLSPESLFAEVFRERYRI